MNNISNLIYLVLAQAGGPEAAEEVQETAQTVAVTGMRWDGWLMLIIGILLLYGGLACCLWIAVGRGKKDTWKEDEDAEQQPTIELME